MEGGEHISVASASAAARVILVTERVATDKRSLAVAVAKLEMASTFYVKLVVLLVAR